MDTVDVTYDRHNDWTWRCYQCGQYGNGFKAEADAEQDALYHECEDE